MSEAGKLLLSPRADVQRALEVINDGGCGLALVVDEAGRLLGTVSDGDIRRHLLAGGGTSDSLETLYQRRPLIAEAGFDASVLREEMLARGVKLVPLLEDGRPTRLLGFGDLLDDDAPALLGGAPIFEQPVPVARPTLPPYSELETELRQVLESGIISNGPQVEAFEAEAAAWIGVRPEQVIAVANCTTGLLLALATLESPGEVVMPSFTYFATGLSAVWNGLTPVLVDARSGDFNLDPQAARRAVTEHTRAIVAVYIFGCPPPLEELRRLADEHRLPLILDAAHGLGAAYQQLPAGRFGEIEIFSLSPTKPVTAAEGGLVVCRNEETAREIRRTRNLGILDSATDPSRGLNGRMSELHAVLGRACLRSLPVNLAHRRRLVELYKEELAGIPGLRFQEESPLASSTFKDFAIVVSPEELGISRNALAEGLNLENIATKRYFDPPQHLQRRFAGKCLTHGSLAVTERLSESILCLPLWSHQEEDTVRRVARAVRRLIEHGPAVTRRLERLRREPD